MDVKRRVKATYLTFLPLYIFSSFFIKMKGLANRPQKCKKGVQKNVQAPPRGPGVAFETPIYLC